MKQLSEALARFVQQQNLYNDAYGLFQNHDIQPRTENLADCWDRRIPVSPELEYLYSHYEMIDAKAAGTHKLKNAAVEIGDAAVLFFAAPEHLYRQQLGYRWITSGELVQESSSWPPHHVVIANFNDDPVIVDTSAPDSPVYAAFEGGAPQQVADSLANFFTALSILIESACTFKGELKDEDTYETKTAYIEHVKPLLHPLLSENQTTHLMEYLSLC
ncbi:hypothetical protein MF628_004182 [Paenibacillus polymyxa]|uniref:hypothetical protein n=1 Tax=Paenibacillus polymyxa TaxID=1406 RepID=UPI002025167F|nr:hypothetical protein [Paenibacillus polymyxa]URJ44457.1 hypothetical protein MF628_004182 [Paenibacillus polymyxa]